MYITDAQAKLATALAELNKARLSPFPSGSQNTDKMVLKTTGGVVIIDEDGTVTFTPSPQIVKSLRESYKSVERGYSLISGSSGVPCPTCGGSGKV